MTAASRRDRRGILASSALPRPCCRPCTCWRALRVREPLLLAPSEGPPNAWDEALPLFPASVIRLPICRARSKELSGEGDAGRGRGRGKGGGGLIGQQGSRVQQVKATTSETRSGPRQLPAERVAL